MYDQYHAFPAPIPPESPPESPADPPPLEPPTPGRSMLPPYPPGVAAEDPSGTALLVPRHLVTSSRYRAVLPYAPDSLEVRRALKAINREGYTPPPARWIDGRFEVCGHEVLFDALQASGTDPIRIRPVNPATEEEAYVLGRCERDKHAPPPSHYELIRDVWTVRLLEGCTTWTRVGEILGYRRSTVTHAQRDGSRITPAVVERAGVDEHDPEHIAMLRGISGKRLRWAAKGQTPDDCAIRLALVFGGEAPGWATPEQVEANREEPRPELRERRGRDGAVIAVAELSITGATKEGLKKSLRDYQKMVLRLFDELNPADSDQIETG